MGVCHVVSEQGLRCVCESEHTGDHWFQEDANICDFHDPMDGDRVCTLARNHAGDHRFNTEITPVGSVARVFRRDDPESTRQRELDALNPPPDPTVPDNSDLEGFADTLPIRDQVALWAGRILRKEAQIESMLQMIHHELSGGGLSYAVVPSLFGRLLDDVIKMLKAAQIDDGTYVPDVLAALVRLKAAHERRNRVVHDQWIERQVAPGEFMMVNTPKGLSAPRKQPEAQWEVGEFQQSYEELRFCAVMVSGIYWSIRSFIGEHPDIWRDMLPSNREAIGGRFTLTGESHWQFNDESFVAQLNESMRRQAEEFRARMAQHFPDSSLDDGS